MKLERGDFSLEPRLIPLSLIAVIIGGLSCVTALILIDLIQLVTNLFFFGHFGLTELPPSDNQLGLWVISIPVLGSLLVGLMARYGTEKIRGHGIPEALETILFGKSLMEPKVAVLKPLSSAISIGSGGPFGAEGPIIMTGGAVGSIFAQMFRLSSAERKTLLVAGAAAGMSAVFATPISAVLLSVELLLFEWRPRSLIPVALASLVAAVFRPYLLGAGPIFPLQANVDFVPPILGVSVVVGLLGGIFATVVSRSLYRLEDGFAKLPIHWMWWPALGGLVVGIGGYFQPRVLGVGYDVILDLLNNRLDTLAVVALVGVKAIVWVFALASGTSGGVLAPLLIMGAALGVIEAALLPQGMGSASLWALVSMAAVLGGMMRAPFTACLFALELTQDVAALPVIFIASIVAYGFTVIFMKRSILTEKVARRGFDIFREYGVDPLERVRVDEAMTHKPQTISDELTSDLLRSQYFTGPKRHRGYPIVNSAGELVGVLTASDLLEIESKSDLAALKLRDLPKRKLITVCPADSCRIAAERMAYHSIGRLPVVSPEDPNRILGIITRSDLLKARVISVEEEETRRRYIEPLGIRKLRTIKLDWPRKSSTGNS